jgi:hypothetical protein
MTIKNKTNNNKSKLKSRKQFNINQGYKLHKDRLKLASNRASSVRSMKFPLVSNNEEAFNAFFDAIKHDYKFIVGDFNFVDWCNNVNSGSESEFSLLKLWKKSVSQGILIAKDEASATNCYRALVLSDVDQKSELELKIDDFINKFSSETGFSLNPQKVRDNFFKEKRNKTSLEDFIKFVYECGDVTNRNIPEDVYQSLKSTLKPFWGVESEESLELFKQSRNKFLEHYGFNIVESNSTRKLFSNSFFSLSDFINSYDFESNIDIFHEYSKQLDSKSEDLLGLANNQSGLSNFLKTIFNGPKPSTEILEVQRAYEVKNDFVSGKVAKLVDNPADYRTQLGGILSSWLTNRTNRKEEISKNTFISELNNIRKIVDKHSFNEFNEQLSMLERLYDDYKQNNSEAVFLLLENELAEFKSSFNEVVGNLNDNQKDEIYKIFDKLKIPRPIGFPGDAKEAQFLKFYYSHEILSRLLDFYLKHFFTKVIKITNNLEKKDFNNRYLKTLDMLWRQYPDLSTRFQHIIKSYFEKNVFGIDFDANLLNEINRKFGIRIWDTEKFLQSYDSLRYRFYVSPYAKAKFSSIDLRSDIDSSRLVNLYESISPDFMAILDKFEADFRSRLEDLISAVEIEKIRAGLRQFCDSKILDKNTYTQAFRGLDRTKYLDLDLFDKYLERRELDAKFENHMLTTIKGKLALLSRKEELARYIVNFCDTEKKLKLVRLGDKYLISVPSQKLNDVSESDFPILDPDQAFVFDKADNFIKLQARDIKNKHLFEIQSSRYQTQFLYRLFDVSAKIGNKPVESWKDLDLNLSSYSFIAEETYDIEWNLDLSSGLSLSISYSSE